MGPDLVQVFGSYMPWKLDAKTWIIQFMNGSEYMYLLEGDEKALLIDTGWGAGNLRPLVEKLTDKPVIVVNSHYHPDHAGGNGEFEEVYMSRNYKIDGPAVDKKPDDSGVAPFDLTKLPHPDYKHTTIGDGYIFDLGGRQVEVFDAKPAHCNSSLFFLDRGHRMLFTGDEIESQQTNLFNDPKNEQGEICSLKEVFANFKDNVQRMWSFRDSYDYVCPNHNGTPIAKDYMRQYAELVDAIYDKKVMIEDKLNHFWIEKDPIAPELCRVRYEDISIFVRKKDLLAEQEG